MKFGFLTECYVREGKTHSQAYADTFAQVEEAESLEMDSVWLVEQHFRPWASILPSPMLMASALATRTRRMPKRALVLSSFPSWDAAPEWWGIGTR